MPRPKGLPKTGGRVRGTPNRNIELLAKKLAKLGCDPLEGLAKIALENTEGPRTCPGDSPIGGTIANAPAPRWQPAIRVDLPQQLFRNSLKNPANMNNLLVE